MTLRSAGRRAHGLKGRRMTRVIAFDISETFDIGEASLLAAHSWDVSGALAAGARPHSWYAPGWSSARSGANLTSSGRTGRCRRPDHRSRRRVTQIMEDVCATTRR